MKIEIRPQRAYRFNCPNCRVNSLFRPIMLHAGTNLISENQPRNFYTVECQACASHSLWICSSRKDNYDYDLELVHPISSDAPRAVNDMPEDVKADYNEARLVYIHSSRAAAALLRLALQKLCKHLGEKGENINFDIRELARKDEFSDRLIQAADTVRITGNNAVHPGEMNEEDIDDVCEGLFKLLNLIVLKGITEPKQWDALYAATPEGSRRAAEKADSR